MGSSRLGPGPRWGSQSRSRRDWTEGSGGGEIPFGPPPLFPSAQPSALQTADFPAARAAPRQSGQHKTRPLGDPRASIGRPAAGRPGLGRAQRTRRADAQLCGGCPESHSPKHSINQMALAVVKQVFHQSSGHRGFIRSPAEGGQLSNIKKFLEGNYLVRDKKQPIHLGPVSGSAGNKNNKGNINHVWYTLKSDQKDSNYHHAVRKAPKLFTNPIPLVFTFRFGRPDQKSFHYHHKHF